MGDKYLKEKSEQAIVLWILCQTIWILLILKCLIKKIYSREIDTWQSSMIPFLVVFLFAAVDKFCLYLTSSVGKRGSYINAISVSVSY